jgi:hypothetical protein
MSQMSKKYKTLFLIILLLSIGLRIGLVSVNREANDPHDEVIQYIIEKGTLPDKDECWECFQPKLFHYTAAQILRLPCLTNNRTADSLALQVEIINLVAGILALLVIGLFIARLTIQSEMIKLLTFGLIALNPKFIGINAQYTNDTFAILFSTLALFFAMSYLQKEENRDFVLMLLFVSMGISTKTNVWVIVIAIFMAFLVKAWTQKGRFLRSFSTGFLFIIITLAIAFLNPLNQYIHNIRYHDTPMLLNIEKKEFPHYFAETEVGLPGVLSIYDGFFTFKFADLLDRPLIDTGEEYTPVRTSLWTMLYARTHSIHFNNYPSTWAADGEKNFNLSRTIYLMALFPTMLILFGYFLEVFALLKGFFTRNQEFTGLMYNGLGAITFTGYLGFIVLYALTYRDFSVMKPVFLYPGIIFFALFFARALEFIKTYLGDRLQWLSIVFTVWMVILFGLYSADIVTMIQLIASK